MRKLVILRGLPGSGKSYEASKLFNKHSSPYVAYCSADTFFIKEEKYQFNPKLLPAAHDNCKNKAFVAMHEGFELIIIDNTNTQKWEYKEYVDMGKELGYEVEIIMVGNLVDLALYAERNSHGVPLASIEKMAKRFEM